MSGEGVQLIGWGLGGLLYTSLGLFPTLLIVLLLYLLSTFVMLFLPQAKIEQLEAETNLDTLVKGWKLVAKNPKLKLFVQANLLEDFSNTIWVSSVILVFVTEVLKQTESYWGYSNTAYSNTQTFLIFSSLTGFFSQLKEVPESVFFQETVDENQLVHVYSVFEVISTLAFSVFVFLMSSITEKFGITTSFWLSTICILLEAGLIYHNRNYLK